MPRQSTRALDTRFYRVHHQLPPIWRRGLGRLHYAMWGRRRGLQPHPLFDPYFFVDEAARRGHGGIAVSTAFDQYLDRPELWSIDPHAYVSFAHEPFASQAPKENPLLAAERTVARDARPGDGHPLLNATWWLADRGEAAVGPDPTLGDVLRAVAVEAHASRAGMGEVALGPDPDVLVVNGEDTCPACTQYRVWNPALALRRAGLTTAVINARDLWRLEGVRVSARAVVVFRAIANPQLLQLLQRCKQQGIRIIFDCDDLIFGPEQVYGMMAGRHGVRDREGPNSHIRLVNEVFRYMEHGTFPTEALASAAIDFGLDPQCVHVTPSFLSRAQFDAVPAPATNSGGAGAPPMIAMASGTWTHHDDFATIVPSVSKALANTRAELHALGSLPPEDFANLRVPSDRLKHDSRVIRDWVGYVERYRDYTACLVPLDMDNGFCHAKSEVKYIEAGLAGTPIIASPTEANVRALEGNDSGWLASTAQQWSDAIERAAIEPQVAAAAGERARADVEFRYGPGGSFEQHYVDTMRAILANTDSVELLARNRLSLSAEVKNGIPPELQALLKVAGCDGLIGRRHPRAPDLWIAPDGTAEDIGAWSHPHTGIVIAEVEHDLRALDAFRDATADLPTLIVQGPELASAVPDWWVGEVRVGLPWADATTFSERSTLPRSAARRAPVVLLAPPAHAIGPTEARAAHAWARHADATDARLIIVGASSADLGLALHPSWTPGCSELELATILRECSLAVRLHPSYWGETLTAALLARTPIASVQAPSWSHDRADPGSVAPLRDWVTWTVPAAR